MNDTAPLWAMVGRWLDEADAERRTGFVAGSTKAAVLVECADALARLLGGNVRIDPCRGGHRFGSDGVCHDCRRSLGGHVEATPPPTEPNAVSPEFWDNLLCLDCGLAKTLHGTPLADCPQWRVEVTSPEPPPVPEPRCAYCGHWRTAHGHNYCTGTPQCTCTYFRPND